MGTYGANRRGVDLWEISQCLQALSWILTAWCSLWWCGVWNLSQAEPVLLKGQKLMSNSLEGHD